MDDGPTNLGPSYVCPACHVVLAADDAAYEHHFRFGTNTCVECESQMNLWAVLHGWIRQGFSPDAAYELIGASRTYHRLQIRRERNTPLDLVSWGVPEKATILSLSFTAVTAGENGAAFPIVFHGNTMLRDPLPTTLQLYGAAYGREGVPDLTEVMVAAAWISDHEDETPARHLIDAARHHAAGRYDRTVVPANIAVESALSPAIFAGVSSFCSQKHARRFLQDGATYSHQLNVLIPMLCHMVGSPPMTDDLRGLLNRLRSLRNQVAHNGHPDVEVKADDSAELLTSAVFGFRYAKFFKGAVLQAAAEGRLPKAVVDGDAG